MDSDSEVPAVRPDSAGDHSVRSQLIVVSPRSSESTEQRQDPDIMVVINPSAAAGLSSNGDAQGSVSIEMTNIEGQSLTLVRDNASGPSTPPRTPPSTPEGVLALDDSSTVENVSSELSPIEHVLKEALRSRPTIRRGVTGRDISNRFRAKTALPYNRRRAYHSFSYGARRPQTTAALQGREDFSRHRRSSLPDLNNEGLSTINLEEDLFDIMNEDDEQPTPRGLDREEDIRRSTRRLRERLEIHQDQEEQRTKLAQANIFADFYYVKWPKIKSRLRVAASYRLWNGHMKEVEGHFGTAVVSYFVYLRWLFIMNLVIFAVWFGLVVIPNAIYIEVEQPPRTPSLLSCAYPFSVPSNTSCSDDTSISDTDNLFYLLSVSSLYSCTAPSSNTTTLRMCVTEASSLNGTARDIAVRESSDSPVTVSSVMPNRADCTFQGGSNGSGISFQQVRFCSSGIAPHIPWYQYVIDFVLGQGVFNETVLFYGRYGNTDFGGYNLPVAYLFVTGIVYTVSVVLLVYKMGQAYNESYVEVGRSKSINFCNKLFTAWDFNITDPNTAKLRRVQIRTDFEEELADFERRNQKRTTKELAIVITIRIFTNLLTVLVLIGGAVIIFYATQFALENQSSDGLSFEGLVTPVVITTLNLVLPFLFSFLARFERFKTQSGEIKMTLVRAILVRLASLFVLIATIYILIRCTQQVTEETDTGATVCTFDLSTLLSSSTDNTTSTSESSSDCPVCWETFIGQEFYKLGLTNFAVSAASTIGVETFRNIVSRVKYKGLGERIGKGNFNIPKSILDLIYTQSLLWLGFFFSPMLPAVILITSFVLFYVKKYSLIYNLEPDRRGATKTSRNNFLYLLLMLATLGLFLILVGVALGSFRPSESCGPFRGMTSFFAVVSEYVNTFSCVSQLVLDYFATASFVIPVIAFLLLIVYAEYVLLRSRKAKFELIKKQLILEGANVTHIVGRLDNVLQKVADHRQEMMNTIVTSPQHNAPSPSAHGRQRNSLEVSGQHQATAESPHPTPLKKKIEEMRRSITDQDNSVFYSRSSSQESGQRKRSSIPSMLEDDEERGARQRKRSSVPSVGYEPEDQRVRQQRKESTVPLIVEDNVEHQRGERKRRSVPTTLEDSGERRLSSSTANAPKRNSASAH